MSQNPQKRGHFNDFKAICTGKILLICRKLPEFELIFSYKVCSIVVFAFCFCFLFFVLFFVSYLGEVRYEVSSTHKIYAPLDMLNTLQLFSTSNSNIHQIHREYQVYVF